MSTYLDVTFLRAEPALLGFIICRALRGVCVMCQGKGFKRSSFAWIVPPFVIVIVAGSGWLLVLPQLPLEALIKHNQHFINCLKLAIKQSKQPLLLSLLLLLQPSQECSNLCRCLHSSVDTKLVMLYYGPDTQPTQPLYHGNYIGDIHISGGGEKRNMSAVLSPVATLLAAEVAFWFPLP